MNDRKTVLDCRLRDIRCKLFLFTGYLTNGLITCNCFLFVVFCVLFCSVTSYCSVLLFFFCVLYCSCSCIVHVIVFYSVLVLYLFFFCTESACVARDTTLAEVLPCFFLSCKANARV
jgi:hypothetical protein